MNFISWAVAERRAPQDFIDYMKACEDETGGISKLTPAFDQGALVVITDGPFKGLPAKVHDIPDADRVQVLVEMFGREHKVEVQGIYLQKT
jgi:Transcription antiterminator